jgi:hypothetical protein
MARKLVCGVRVTTGFNHQGCECVTEHMGAKTLLFALLYPGPPEHIVNQVTDTVSAKGEGDTRGQFCPEHVSKGQVFVTCFAVDEQTVRVNVLWLKADTFGFPQSHAHVDSHYRTFQVCLCNGIKRCRFITAKRTWLYLANLVLIQIVHWIGQLVDSLDPFEIRVAAFPIVFPRLTIWRAPCVEPIQNFSRGRPHRECGGKEPRK